MYLPLLQCAQCQHRRKNLRACDIFKEIRLFCRIRFQSVLKIAEECTFSVRVIKNKFLSLMQCCEYGKWLISKKDPISHLIGFLFVLKRKNFFNVKSVNRDCKKKVEETRNFFTTSVQAKLVRILSNSVRNFLQIYAQELLKNC